MTETIKKVKLRVGLVAYNDKNISPETITSINSLTKDEHFEIDVVKVTGCSDFHGRNLAVCKGKPLSILTHNFDYYLSVDGDSVFDNNTIRELCSLFEVYKNTKTAVICAPYPRRNRSHEIVAGYLDDKFNHNFLTLHETSHKIVPLIDVDWCGMGCTLIKKSYFMEAEYPWFRVPIIETLDGLKEHTTDDIGFCIQAKAAKFLIKITTHLYSGHIC